MFSPPGGEHVPVRAGRAIVLRRRVVITGLGALSPNGVGVEAFWDGLFAGRSGIRRIARLNPTQHRHDCGGEVWDFDSEQYFSPREAARTGRAVQLCLVAAQMAWDHCGLEVDALDPARFGLLVGVASPVMDVLEEKLGAAVATPGYVRDSPFILLRVTPHMHTVAAQEQVTHTAGYNMTVSMACCSGSNAMGLAAERIRAGHLDVALCGAADSGFSRFTFNTFELTRMMYQTPRAPEAIMRPFNIDRDGGVLSEGAAFLVLEDWVHAQARGATVYGEWLGHAATPAAVGPAKSRQVRRGLCRVMRAALADAGLPPERVDYVSAHAASSVETDRDEAEALGDVFGERTTRMPVSSIKSMIGNPVGAVGPLQSVGLCGSFARGLVPPTINVTEVDPACRLDVVPNRARRNRIRVGMINTHGLDGANACIVLGAPPVGVAA